MSYCSKYVFSNRILYSQVRATSVLQNLKRVKQDLLEYGVASPTGTSRCGQRETDGKLTG